ncbi:MAG: phosphatidate cytidylyltransferase [Clostridia bacterium]|nr:phosphatidate cytidylyltransferase [Clostridia bacterium]
MSETPKTRSSLKQRLITAFALIPVLIAVLAIGGWFAAAACTACLCVALYEELNCLKQGGYRPVQWTAYASLLVGAALSLMHSPTVILLVMGVLILAAQLCVMCRKEPKLLDILVSVLPMLTVALPGLCLISILDTQPRALQLMLLVFVFASSIGCDTLAYFVGSTVGGPKLCPHISPKKTVSGAIGGLVGSVLFMLAVEGGFRLAVPELFAGMSLWWTIAAALVCGVAAQMGDLFASMVKRHCQVKDFGSIFPGHGGMMDRLDSVLFTSIVIFCYRALLLGLI